MAGLLAPTAVPPWAGVLAVLLVVAGTAGLHRWAPPPLVPPVGDVVAEQGDQGMTEWLAVPEGEEVRWYLSSDGYIDYLIEARGVGFLDGGDGSGTHGCARAEQPFAVRMWWGNLDWLIQDGAARVAYSLTVEADNASRCATAALVAQESGVSGNPRSVDDPPPGVVVLPLIAGNLAMGAGLVLARRLPKGVRH